MRITEENYVDEAEKVILKMKTEKEKNVKLKLVTTTKLRGLLSMLSDIYNEIMDVSEEQLNVHVRSRIDYLRVRFVYEAGKEPTVKKFVQDAKLLEHLKDINGKKSGFLLFYHYMEALVAFFKFNDLDEKER